MAGKTQIGDWLYFCPQEITVREIYNVFPELEGTEIWEEAGVLEIPMGEKSLMLRQRKFIQRMKLPYSLQKNRMQRACFW